MNVVGALRGRRGRIGRVPGNVQRRRVRNVIGNMDRQRLVDAYENGNDYLALADQLHINRDSARNVIRVWMADGRVNRLPMGGTRNGNVRVDQEMVNEILLIVQQKPFTTLVSINDTLHQRLPNKPRITTSTIARHLENQLISVKIAGKDADIPFRRNTPQTKETRFNYATWLSHLAMNHKLMYIDESGFNLYQRRTQGRARVGQPVRRNPVENSRGRNINVIIALSSEGVIHFTVSTNTLDHARYQTFIDELVTTAAPMFNDPVHIIHDGARPHLRTIINGPNVQQFDIVQLPPYSPFLNPVELAHSCFKAAVGRSLTLPHVQAELLDNDNVRQQFGVNHGQWRSRVLSRLAEEAINRELTQAKCMQWCNHIHRFIPPSLARADVL